MESYEHLPYNFRCLIEELKKRGISCRLIPTTDVLEASYRGHTEFLLPAHNRLIPANYEVILNDKYYLKMLLKEHGISVQEGSVFHQSMDRGALNYVLSVLGFPVVIKATGSANGDYVHVNIRDKEEFIDVWQNSVADCQNIHDFLVERYFDPPIDYRFFVMDGVPPVVVKRIPPSIVGNGKSSLVALIEEENERRMNPRKSCVGAIYLEDFEGNRTLRMQSLCMDSVLIKGQEVALRYNSNIRYGGMCEMITESVHPSYFELTKGIFQLFPGLGYLFIDLFSKDITEPVSEGDYAINEVSTALSLSMFTQPSKGAPFDIVTPIIDRLFPEI